MTTAKGYYSLIQYCPDQTRLEAATIGVLLFCPERTFLKAMTARDNRRIRRFFGREGHDWSRINSFKAAIEERLEVEQPEMQSVADLETFISLRANQFQITSPRPMRVNNPEEDLKTLFDEVVGGPSRKQQARSFQRYVGERLFKAGLRSKVRTNIEVVVPIFNRRVFVPYGFQNDRFRLIQPVRFMASNPDQAMSTACRYAAEGRSLWENPHPDFGPVRLMIVGKFRPQHPQTKEDVCRILTVMDSNVDLLTSSELDRLIDEIRTTGKDIPADSLNANAPGSQHANFRRQSRTKAMYLLENPVLQRELLVNLRMLRGFVLLFVYVASLGLVVYVAWPGTTRLDLTTSPAEARQLVNLFFLGQYVLLSLMAPSFAAGAITGEKERRTYEMLLASPLRPEAIVLGKLLASLSHLAVLVFASLPIVMLCLPLGGVSPYEVLATYLAMAASVVAFGMICVTASSFFTRTIAALVVSYLLILPMVLFGVLFYKAAEEAAEFRLVVLAFVIPAGCAALCGVLLRATSRRLLHPPDVGAEAKEVVDPDIEQRAAVGMVIRSEQWPDKLFAPAKRIDMMQDGLNPVYDKEMRSELFGQGTLMLRLVIQLSMALGLLLMAICLYVWPPLAPWYAGYVLVFNMLVGPVFSAGALTSERERETLELLLCTTLSPWQILSGKLFSSLRISLVLTSFLVWPLLLACLLPPWTYWSDMPTLFGYSAIIALSGLTTTILPIFCSVIFRKTSVSMMTSYLAVILLFALPVAAEWFARLLFPLSQATAFVGKLTFSSPFSACFSLPLGPVRAGDAPAAGPVVVANWPVFCGFFAFYAVLNLVILAAILWLFNKRWRVST